MHITDYVLLTGSLCGIIMVLGGILLLYRGAMSLSAVSAEEALAVEYKKELRLSTQYPALAFFLIGLLFVALSIVMAPAPEQVAKKLRIVGEAIDINEPVRVSVIYRDYVSEFDHTRIINDSFVADVDAIQIKLSAPGYIPHRETVLISALDGDEINLGEIKLRQAFSRDDFVKTGAVEQ